MPRVLVTGANRGIGLEFARQYAADGWEVVATARSEARELVALGVRLERLDLRDFAAVEAFGRSLAAEGALDLFVANAGVTAAPRIGSAGEAAEALEVLAVNAVAPTLLARLLVPALARAGGRMAAITSEMGSIADSSGGYLGYRASKAALNAAWHGLAQELGARVPLVLLHPGWVQTDMGGPNAKVPARQSVSAMRRIIERLGPEQTGAFLDFRGNPLRW